MDLGQFTLTTSFLLVFLGFLFTNKSNKIEFLIKNFPRSKVSAVFLLCIGIFWFLFRHVNNLGEADFGEYKVTIGVIGILVVVASFFFIFDFLAVRALCIVILFYSREVLDAAFLQEPISRLFLVSIIYFFIVVSLYFGAWPYRLRDFLNWLFKNYKYRFLFGSFFLTYSVILVIVRFTY